MNLSNLHLGEPQTIVLIGFVVIALLIAIAFVIIGINSRKDVEYEQVTQFGYWLRKRWFILLLVVLSLQVGIALAFMPYSVADTPDVNIAIKGYQFNWAIDEPKVKAGSVAEIAVTTADVTHGVGLYDPDGHLLASVQAMPGYTNRFEVKLDKPGRYRIACMEYCGIGHHKMINQLDVGKDW